jgi:hypothetical protein
MTGLHLVGAGALGSTFATELARRSYALQYPLRLVIYDFDFVEERNLAAQDYGPLDVGLPKADALAARLAGHRMLEVCPVARKLAARNVDQLVRLEAGSVLVDAVDNLTARHLIWRQGIATDTPVLHLGLSRKGMGNVTWTYRECDTWELSPRSLSPATQAAVRRDRSARVALPPCELTGFRSLILNTAMAGLNALFIALGFDVQRSLPVSPGESTLGILTTWATTPVEFRPVYELTEVTECFSPSRAARS